MKRLAAVILTASMGLALAGCSGNPYKEGVSQLESKKYKQAEASFKEAVKQVTKYKYEEAKKVHEKKRKKSRPRITFDQLDNEYWGFES